MLSKDTKKNKIQIMFYSLKVLALFFSSIPIFQYIFEHLNISSYNFFGDQISLSLSMIIVVSIILIWTAIFNLRLFRGSLHVIVELILFFAMFIFAIYISGADKSYYKFLFLFIIVSYTIEYGMRTGLIIASVSSAIVLAIDIIFGGFTALNEYFQNDLALSAMFLVVSWTLGFYVKLENSHIEQLTEYANRDGLTGLYNHRFFHEYLESLFQKCVEEKRDLSLLIFDIDYFKDFNDMCGHQKGDALLKELAGLIKKHLRSHELLCRYGGDEFCVILPDTGKTKAGDIAQRISGAVGTYQLDSEDYLPDAHLTISIGVSTLDSETSTYAMLIENADTALYRAKFLHRNRVEVYSSIFDHFDKLENDKIIEESLKSMRSVIAMIHSRDNYTAKHVERVVDYCRIMSDYLSLGRENKKRLMYSAYLHDVGKINIPKGILNTPKKLTDDEWLEIKKCPLYSVNIIKQMEGFESIVSIVMQHHEKYDGTGYPEGLVKDDISYLARVLTIVESFDAMTNYRPYQKTKTFEEAFEELERCRGGQFDPILTDLFIEMLKSQ